MAGAALVDIEVVIPRALTHPAPLDPYLRAGVGAGITRIQAAAEANIASRTRAGGGRQWQARRGGKGGYGPLGGSVTTHLASEPGAYAVGYARTITFYARFLESGAKDHPIRATGQSTRRVQRASALLFTGRDGPIFRRRVFHPGIRPRFWMRDAAESQRAAVIEGITEATRRWTLAVQGAA